jgi:hypothetical protein
MLKITLNYRWIVAVLALLGTNAVFAQVSSSSSVDSIISDERTRQIARQISDNIARRISSDIDATFKSSALQTSSLSNNGNPMAASADRNLFLNDASLWSIFSWSRISNDGDSLGADFDVDIFQSTSGIDKKMGDFYFGGSLTYAYSHTDVGDPAGFGLDVEDNVHSVALTPYVAYVINKHLFLSALAGYTYTNNNPKASFATQESETDSYNTELALNGLHIVDKWYMKGKVGARYIHGHLKTDPFLAGGPVIRDNTDSWTYLVDGEGGYSFGNGIRLYSGVLFEYNNPKPSLGQADGVF